MGVYWARWGDALRDAGFTANEKNRRTDGDILLEKLAQAFRHHGRIPTTSELRMYRRVDQDFPHHSTLDNHFRTKADMVRRLRMWVAPRAEYSDVAKMLSVEEERPSSAHPKQLQDGFVYLIRSGQFYKIGRSEELERRVKEIKIALPDAATLSHTIRTDDPAGIEVYWHRRFSDRRANGEWFKLTPADVAAFKRRRYQ